MTWLRVFSARIRAMLNARRLDRELEEELRSHIEMETEANIGRGMSPAQARRQALLEFGGISQTAELYREGRTIAWLEALGEDVRFALRGFARAPGFTAVAILSLGLGIGVNVAIFSMINMLLLRPLPVPDASRLVVLGSQQKGGFPMPAFAYADYRDIREQTAATFSGLLAYYAGLDGLSAEGHADRIMTHYVTGNYFTLLGLQPALGRVILPSEGKVEGADPVLVLGYSFWKARFASDPNVIGKKVLINGHPVTVVGVGPRNFHGVQALVDIQAFLPLSLASSSAGFPSLSDIRSIRNLYVMGRLAPGVSLDQAQSKLKIVSQHLAADHPNDLAGVTITAQPQISGKIPNGEGLPAAAAFFLAMAALVLVLACINLANLLMVRAGARQKETAMRAALGGSRIRLVRQFLTESFLLTIFGAVTGVFLSVWTCSALGTLKAQGVPLYLDLSFDGRVLAFTAGASIFAGLMLGLIPALRGSRTNLAVLARDGGQRLSGSRQRMRSVLVMGQVAASFVLLLVAALLINSLEITRRTDLGFDPHNIANFSMDPHHVGYNETQGRQFYQELLRRVRGLPEVESAGIAISGPLSPIILPMQVQPEGYEFPKGQSAPTVFYDIVSPGFFQTLRIPLVRGRQFRSSDNQNAPLVAMVNQALADRYWPGQNPIGKKILRTPDPTHWLEVVGVLKDVRYLAVPELRQPYVFFPFEQSYVPIQTLRVRYRGATDTAMAEVRKEIANLAPGLPVAGMETMRQQIESSAGFVGLRLETGFATVLGLLGLALALLGIYGVVSYTAAQRTHEIGVRLTLGASAHDIRKLVLGRGLLIICIGLPAGLLLAFATAPILRSLLPGVRATDPWMLSMLIVLLSSVTLVACYIPARRAMRADASSALRNE
ncbi:MAG TPA: ABC transporter permease [Bryobacteraceae bacterium]|nr:ABC transporter permease [Bryobacteraceae bacterium]